MYIFLLILLSTLSLQSCSSWDKDITPIYQSGSIKIQPTEETKESRENRETVKKEQARKRMQFSTFISKWDYYTLKNDTNSALQFYLTTLSMLDSDPILNAKVANVYFKQKDWVNAYIYFSKISEHDILPEDRELLYKSLYFNDSITDKRKALNAVQDTWTGAEGRKNYYRILEACYSGIHNCVVTLESYSWSHDASNALKNIVKWYSTISPDYQYRNALLAGKLFELKQYYASYILSKEILSNRPDYQEIIKMLWYASYELGKYEEAKIAFEKYLEYAPKDLKIIYILGEVNFYMKDYVTSNLYYNNAVINGYKPKTNIERRLIYNYYILEDYESMMKVFRYLLQESDLVADDYIIGVHMAHDTWDYKQALDWANSWVLMFPQSDMLYALRWVTLRRIGDYTNGMNDIAYALSINTKNPIALMEQAYIENEMASYDESKKHIQEVLENTSDAVLNQEAQRLLDEINTKETNISPTDGNLYEAPEDTIIPSESENTVTPISDSSENTGSYTRRIMQY